MKEPRIPFEADMHELANYPIRGSRIAFGQMFGGIGLTLFTIFIAIKHFVYGTPVQDEHTGLPIPPAEVIALLFFMGGGGLFFIIMGFKLRRMILSRRNGS